MFSSGWNLESRFDVSITVTCCDTGRWAHDTVENLRKSLLLKGQHYGVDPARFFRVIGFLADADDIQT